MRHHYGTSKTSKACDLGRHLWSAHYMGVVDISEPGPGSQRFEFSEIRIFMLLSDFVRTAYTLTPKGGDMRINGFAVLLTSILAASNAVAVHAQDSTQQQAHMKHFRYRLVDLGTFGGPFSYVSANGPGGRILNNAGVVSSYADTTLPDPYAPDFCWDQDCLVAHSYRWRGGVLEDLG